MQVQGKVFVVTGGGNGIGREVVLELLRREAHVAALDLRPDSLEGTRALAAAGPGRLTTHAVDVSDRVAVDTLVGEVTAAHGQVDAVLNVAGVIQPFARFEDLTVEAMERVVAVNFWGVVHVCQAFLPELRRRPEASLVNVASMGALAPVPGQSAYGASKAAVTLLTEALYAELLETPVAVTVVFPGAVATGIAENSGAALPGRDATSSELAASMTTAPDAARQIVEAVEAGPFRVTVGKDARMLDRLSRLAPRRATELVARRMASLLR